MAVISRIVIAFCIFGVQFSFAQALTQQPTFEGSEHILLGDQIKLFFSRQDPGQLGYLLHLPNGLRISYGDIVSFGDLYGPLNISIAHGSTDAERKALFLAAFNAFASNLKAKDEAEKLLAVLHHEKKLLEDGIERGEDPEKIFQKIGSETSRQLNCITGGGCNPKTWFLHPGRYLLLANIDFDHFGDDAWLAYQTGHEIALAEAFSAHATGDLQKLEIAYAMNAFASHFLSDRFSAGHIRTPRDELYDMVTPSFVGSLLAGFMHREENSAAIHVHNKRDDHWLAFGDRKYLCAVNSDNRHFLNEALQSSARQIFDIFVDGFIREDVVPDILPYADETLNQNQKDLSPMFYFDPQTKKLLRRVDLENIYDRHFTDHWWGLSTLALLTKARGLPLEAQDQFKNSEWREWALQHKLIPDSFE